PVTSPAISMAINGGSRPVAKMTMASVVMVMASSVSDFCASWRRDQSRFIPTLIGAATWPAGADHEESVHCCSEGVNEQLTLSHCECASRRRMCEARAERGEALSYRLNLTDRELLAGTTKSPPPGGSILTQGS